LSAAPQKGWMVQSFAPGITAKKVLDLPQADAASAGDIRAEVLTLAGAWLAAFHDARPTSPREVRTATMLDHARSLLGSAISKEIDADCTAIIRALGYEIEARAAAADKKHTLSGAIHGDYVPQNLLIHKDQITGLDIAALHLGPNAHDQAKFIARLYWARDSVTITARDLHRDIAALEAGYGRPIADDPAFAYLFPIQVLTDLTQPKCAGHRRDNLLLLAESVVEMGRG